MQQVVDLQSVEAFEKLGVQLLAVSPDPVAAWKQEGGSMGITVPMLSDPRNCARVRDAARNAAWSSSRETRRRNEARSTKETDSGR
jgi:peroxiredoxin